MRTAGFGNRCSGAQLARGFGVIELMVAVAISLLLLAGVVAIFVSSKNSYETNERLSRIQENGRFALNTIMTDLRASGFVGCARQPGSFGRRRRDLRHRRADGQQEQASQRRACHWQVSHALTPYDYRVSGVLRH